MSLVSVIVPSHARADLLGRLLESVARQTFRDFDVVVVDDASPQEHEYQQVVSDFSEAMTLRYLRNAETSGAQFSRNRGVAASSGELLAFVDDDDEWLPRKLELQTRAFASAPETLGLVYGWADTVRQDGERIFHYRSRLRGDVLRDLLHECFIPSPTVMARRAAVLEAGGFDEGLVSCQDWDMWTRIAGAGFMVDVVEEVVALHHKHERASIGRAAGRLDGYRRFYEKHAGAYARAGMARRLSQHLRHLANEAEGEGRWELAEDSWESAIEAWPQSWRARLGHGRFALRRRFRQRGGG